MPPGRPPRWYVIPLRVLLVTFLLPISALLLGVLALGETITVRALVGMLLIGAGLAAIDGRMWKALGPKKPAAIENFPT